MSDYIKKPEKNKPEHIKKFETLNKNVSFNIEMIAGEYCIYRMSFDERIEYIHWTDDLETITKIANFMLDAYNEGYKDGKNSAILFIND